VKFAIIGSMFGYFGSMTAITYDTDPFGLYMSLLDRNFGCKFITKVIRVIFMPILGKEVFRILMLYIFSAIIILVRLNIIA